MSDIIVCENLIKIYKTPDLEVLALQGLDLNIAAGELMAIIGNSGSGKTTLMNILSGLDHPTEGQVFIEDQDITKLSEHKRELLRRKEIGFVFQSVALVPMMSASENV